MTKQSSGMIEQITRHLDLGDDEITRRLGRYGEVTFGGGIWSIKPTDDEEFCRLTDFSMCERKYRFFFIVPHQLCRVSRLLTSRRQRSAPNVDPS
jgi:hypothetical protein